MRRSALGAASVLVAMVAGAAPAQPRPITVSAHGPERGVAGGQIAIALRATIQPGWHLYSLNEPAGGPIATRIEVGPLDVARVAGAIDSPIPQSSRDPNFGLTTEFFEDSAVFRIPVALSSTLRDGRRVVHVTMRYQACSSRLCLRPRTDTVQVPLVIGDR